MSAFVTLICPDCGYHKVYNGRGYCRCGSYHLAYWKWMSKGATVVLPYGKTIWLWDDIKKPRLWCRAVPS